MGEPTPFRSSRLSGTGDSDCAEWDVSHCKAELSTGKSWSLRGMMCWGTKVVSFTALADVPQNSFIFKRRPTFEVCAPSLLALTFVSCLRYDDG